jgi:uncharacterized UPF0160 family protein
VEHFTQASFTQIISHLITSNLGCFTDESLAVYLLHQTDEFKDAEVIRTRDSDEIAKADIVVDVGGKYIPEKHRYDHHQREFNFTFDDNHKTKLSSAGLVYKVRPGKAG